MNERFYHLNSRDVVDPALDSIRHQLRELYGEETGEKNYTYLYSAAERYLSQRSEEELAEAGRFNPEKPFAHLAGKVFAISYPDHLYDDSVPTLQTLRHALKTWFPGITGVHILPDRLMSHPDIWPQDFFSFLDPKTAKDLADHLVHTGVLDSHRYLTGTWNDQDILTWLENKGITPVSEIKQQVITILEAAYNSHFNDGGFSQKDRSVVDPRFGDKKDIQDLSASYEVMLDFVANHLDVDNPVLEAFKKGENDGSAFITITPDEYSRLKQENTLLQTFRPRPFPLFTGLRKYPAGKKESREVLIGRMEKQFEEAGLAAPDPRVTRFLSIYFKIANNQGLTAEDRRVFSGFTGYLEENNIASASIFIPSDIQPQQFVFSGQIGTDMSRLLEALGMQPEYADVFRKYEDEILGERFFVYTTFSESQSDLNPASPAGFSLLIDDLFHLLSSGNLAMLRLDAVKYLWKEIGKKNFDLAEGNQLIQILRQVLRLVAPRVLPVDEVNSPDQVVYHMGEGGGFAYLFGQVNAVPVALNEGTLEPLRRLYQTMKAQCPPDLVLFVMLSTHDGRSVQGIGVHRSDGHVSIEQFYRLKEIIEQQGGKPKFRSVPAGQIPLDTFEKVCRESGLEHAAAELLFLFDKQGDTLHLKNPELSRAELLSMLGEIGGLSANTLEQLPAIDFFLEWILSGKTDYELCCTTRSSLRSTTADGSPLSPEREAKRLALAQLYTLTFGQTVPAIYVGDLLGLKNDNETYSITGKPRDLNRHKNYLPETGLDSPDDPFKAAYVPLLNTILRLRGEDKAFYPGSPSCEYRDYNDSIFLNHPYSGGDHSFILGNILSQNQTIELHLPDLAGITDSYVREIQTEGLTDLFTGERHTPGTTGTLTVRFGPYSYLWLKKGK